MRRWFSPLWRLADDTPSSCLKTERRDTLKPPSHIYDYRSCVNAWDTCLRHMLLWPCVAVCQPVSTTSAIVAALQPTLAFSKPMQHTWKQKEGSHDRWEHGKWIIWNGMEWDKEIKDVPAVSVTWLSLSATTSSIWSMILHKLHLINAALLFPCWHDSNSSRSW